MRKIVLILFTIIFAAGFLVVNEVKAGPEHNVSGWAWSENIGWISFNSTNCDSDGVGGSDGVGACPAAGTPVPSYGVNIDPAGVFSGFAWSEGVGWISFNRTDTGAPPGSPDYGTHLAQVNTTTGEVSGWARALAFGGGWDGWIKLRKDSADSGANYGVFIDTATGEFHNFSWGSDVVGWASFNCQNQGVCASSDYKVMTSFAFGPPNNPPSTSGLNYASPDYCISGPSGIFTWSFSDPDGDPQDACQVQIRDENNILVYDSCSNPYIDTCLPGYSSWTHSIQPGWGLGYDHTYSWLLKVWDDRGGESGWEPGPLFLTPPHTYPEPDFTHSPQSPVANEQVLFTDTSTCYDAADNPYPCKTNPSNRYQWYFEDDGIIDCDSNIDPNCRGDVTHTYLLPGPYTVRLYVTDNSGTCDTIDGTPVIAGLPLPKWKEIPPF